MELTNENRINPAGRTPNMVVRTGSRAVMWLCLVAIVMVICGAIVASIGLATGAFSFHHNTTTTITSILTDIKGESKFVVATTAKSVYLSRSDVWRGWFGIYLGTTSVRMRVDGCKVQYYVPLTDFTAEDIKISPDGKTVDVTLPHPILDENFVDIPTDPQNYWVEKSSGWARFDKNSMEADLRRELRAAAILQEHGQKMDELLEIAAKQRATEFFIKTCTALRGPGIVVRVTFRESRIKP